MGEQKVHALTYSDDDGSYVQALFSDPAPLNANELVMQWPEVINFSMAPYGYTVLVNIQELTATCARYRCSKCDFEVSLDPRDMTVEFAKGIFRAHVDQSH